MPTPETVAAYAGTITLVVAILVQLIKTGIIDPRSTDSPARDALIRTLSYALNLGGLLGVLALNHLLDWSQLLAYVALALGQAGVAHLTYTVLSNRSQPAPALSGAGVSASVSDVGGDMPPTPGVHG